MKVLLADPPAPKWNTYMRSFPNLGILYLAAQLRDAFPEIQIVYLDSNNTVEEHLEFIAKEKPEIYGISFASPLYAFVKTFLPAVRERLPNSFLLAGGPHPTADPQGCLNDLPIDACCIGEGEETVTELVQAMLSGGDIGKVAGIAIRDDAGTIKYGPHRLFVRDINTFPLPAWDLVDFSRFSGLRQAKSNPS